MNDYNFIRNLLQRPADSIILQTRERSLDSVALNQAMSEKFSIWNAAGIRPRDCVALSMGRNRLEDVISYLVAIQNQIIVLPFPSGINEAELKYRLDIASVDFLIQENGIIIPSNGGNVLSELPGGFISFTSGTTGLPKAIFHSWKNLISNCDSFNKLSGMDSSTNMLHVMPIFYMAGVLNTILSPLVAGGSIFVSDTFSPSSILTFWKDLIRFDLNTVWLSPTMLSLVTKFTRDENIISEVTAILKNIYVATAPLADATKEAFEKKFHLTCRQSYGMTEVLLVSVQSSEGAMQINDVGKLLPEVHTATAEDGELLLKTPFIGIEVAGSEIRKLCDMNQVFNTGDIAIFNESLDITGRKKDIIIKGGLNVHPARIESLLLALDTISGVAVVGKPDQIMGEKIIVFVETTKNTTKEEIISFCEEFLMQHEMPDEIRFCTSMERTPTGKIKKQDLLNAL